MVLFSRRGAPFRVHIIRRGRLCERVGLLSRRCVLYEWGGGLEWREDYGSLKSKKEPQNLL